MIFLLILGKKYPGEKKKFLWSGHILTKIYEINHFAAKAFFLAKILAFQKIACYLRQID